MNNQPLTDDRIREIYQTHYIGRSESANECAQLIGYAGGASFIYHCQRLNLRLRDRSESRQARSQIGQPWTWPEKQSPPQTKQPHPTTKPIPIGNNRHLIPNNKPAIQPAEEAEVTILPSNILALIHELKSLGVDVSVSIQLNIKG